jgi:putative FmdB family regulatory protein
MPIYEYACPKCRKIFSFLSKRLNPERAPVCPKCGFKDLNRQMSGFAAPRGAKGPEEAAPADPMDDPRMMQAMGELERDMEHLDENNPRHMAHMMRKMKDLMPPGTMPKDLETAIKRLESGEDPEKIEADMGELFNEMMPGMDEMGGPDGGSGYQRDGGLYDF